MSEYKLIARIEAARQRITDLELCPPITVSSQDRSIEKEAIYELIRAQKAFDDWCIKWRPDKVELLQDIKKPNPLAEFYIYDWGIEWRSDKVCCRGRRRNRMFELHKWYRTAHGLDVEFIRHKDQDGVYHVFRCTEAMDYRPFYTDEEGRTAYGDYILPEGSQDALQVRLGRHIANTTQKEA